MIFTRNDDSLNFDPIELEDFIMDTFGDCRNTEEIYFVYEILLKAINEGKEQAFIQLEVEED